MTPLTFRWNFSRVALAAALGAAWCLAGCARQRPRPLAPDAFLAPTEGRDRARVPAADQAGPRAFEEPARVDDAEQGPDAGVPEPEPESGPGVSPTVQEAVRPVPEEGFQLPDGAEAPLASADERAPTTQAARPAPAAPVTQSTTGTAAPQPSGGYQLVGTVLADVNSAPIFADKVLSVLEKPLAAAAREMDERPFRNAAAMLIAKQVLEYVNDELEFAMAKSRLEARDQQYASAAATRWRDEQITRAGGSEEMAKQIWAARGLDFEEQVEVQYRTFMVRLYYQRKEYPKIQISAEDKRRYYQENLQREFSEPERAKFRVILIDPRKRGGRRQALGEVNRLLDRVRSGGADFAELASAESTNDNPSFRQPAGWIARGSFVMPKVEEAAWALEPGKVSDVIEAPNGFYLVKLENKQPGRVLPFADAAVQARITKTMEDAQFRALRRKAQIKLIREAIIRYHPSEEGMIRVAVDMASQKYHHWRSAAAK